MGYGVPAVVTVVLGIFGTRRPLVVAECGNCAKGVADVDAPCPHCGAPFEPDIAKCSHCASWVPNKATCCPKCRVEFHQSRTRRGVRGKDRLILLPKATEAMLEEMRRIADQKMVAREVAPPPENRGWAEK